MRKFAHVSRSSGQWKCAFCLTREGKAVKVQRTIFSECFYVLAMDELSRVTGDADLQVGTDPSPRHRHAPTSLSDCPCSRCGVVPAGGRADDGAADPLGPGGLVGSGPAPASRRRSHQQHGGPHDASVSGAAGVRGPAGRRAEVRRAGHLVCPTDPATRPGLWTRLKMWLE